MNILFQSRSELFDKPGGDTVQMVKLAEKLRDLGHRVEINNDVNADLSGFDIVNIFNINHVVEFFPQFENAKRQDKKVVVSPIYHSYREIERWERETAEGFRKVVNTIVGNQHKRDYLKNIYRILFEGMKEKTLPLLKQMSIGAKNQQIKVIQEANAVFVQTLGEVEDIKKELGVKEFKFVKVVNGVDTSFANPAPEKFVNDFGINNFILQVGRIEPRKNQLNVIAAVRRAREEGLVEDNLFLVFIGGLNNHHKGYYNKFMKEVEGNARIHYLGQQEHTVVRDAMSASLAHVYPSWFETTGLVNIEALLAGTKVVTSGERAKEYVGGYGSYCDPGDVDSIKNAIIKELKNSLDKQKVKEYILSNFTWDISARQASRAYESI